MNIQGSRGTSNASTVSACVHFDGHGNDGHAGFCREVSNALAPSYAGQGV